MALASAVAVAVVAAAAAAVDGRRTQASYSSRGFPSLARYTSKAPAVIEGLKAVMESVRAGKTASRWFASLTDKKTFHRMVGSFEYGHVTNSDDEEITTWIDNALRLWFPELAHMERRTELEVLGLDMILRIHAEIEGWSVNDADGFCSR